MVRRGRAADRIGHRRAPGRGADAGIGTGRGPPACRARTPPAVAHERRSVVGSHTEPSARRGDRRTPRQGAGSASGLARPYVQSRLGDHRGADGPGLAARSEVRLAHDSAGHRMAAGPARTAGALAGLGVGRRPAGGAGRLAGAPARRADGAAALPRLRAGRGRRSHHHRGWPADPCAEFHPAVEDPTLGDPGSLVAGAPRSARTACGDRRRGRRGGPARHRRGPAGRALGHGRRVAATLAAARSLGGHRLAADPSTRLAADAEVAAVRILFRRRRARAERGRQGAALAGAGRSAGLGQLARCAISRLQRRRRSRGLA